MIDTTFAMPENRPCADALAAVASGGPAACATPAGSRSDKKPRHELCSETEHSMIQLSTANDVVPISPPPGLSRRSDDSVLQAKPFVALHDSEKSVPPPGQARRWAGARDARGVVQNHGSAGINPAVAGRSQIVERLVSGRAEYKPDRSPRAATGRFPIWLAFLAALPFVAGPA